MKYQPFESGYFFHLYNRGNNFEAIFKEPANYTHFLNLIEKFLLKVADIYSYCLLPNHFHIIIKFKETDELDNDKTQFRKPIHQPISNTDCYL